MQIKEAFITLPDDGSEIPLVITSPEPDDGTYCLSLPEGQSWPTDTGAWIRIVPTTKEVM